MKFSLFISVALVAVAVGDDPLIGKWTEDSSRRENLKEFLKARGVSAFEVLFSGLPNFQLKMEIIKEGNKYTLSGTKGPSAEAFNNIRVVDNQTITELDLGSKIGGKRNVVSEIVGTSLVSYLTKPEAGGEMDTIITAKPEGTIQMVYTVKDVKSGVELIQHMNKDQ